MKKVLCLFVMAVAMLGITAYAQAEDYEYEIIEDEVVIKLYKGEEAIVAVPEEIENCPVVEIGEHAFAASGIKKITVPDSVTVIGSRAFASCISLEEIVLSENISVIPDALFSGCVNLKKVNIPNVTAIGKEAFKNCISLSEVNIPDSVTTIGAWAFTNCRSIAAINMPKGLKEIGQQAFSRLTSLEEIIIPEGITKIAFGTFHSCSNLKRVVIPETVNYIDGQAFCGNVSLTEVKLPDSLTHIGDLAFGKNTALKEITIPKNVESFGETVFIECENLEKITVSDDNPFVTESGGIVYSKDMTKMIVAAPTLEGKLTIPETVAEIPAGMFEGSKITEVIMPDSVTSVGYSAFEDCSELTKVVISDKVESIPNHMITNSKKLEWVVIGEAVTNIRSEAFYGCEIENVVFKNKDTKIGRTYWYTEGGNNSSYTIPMFESFYYTNVGTMYGFVGSDAESYANEKGFKFENIENVDISAIMAENEADVPVKDKITIMVNGNEIVCDSAPYIKNDRTMVPMRAIFEALGATVSWDGETKTAIGVKGSLEVKITIGENVLYKTGEAIELDAAAEITKDRTMVPVRAISEAFEYIVEWDNETRTVDIVDPYNRFYYVYDENGQVTLTKSANGNVIIRYEYLHDEIGNIIRVWEKEMIKNSDRLFEYTYNEKGQRVSKGVCRDWWMDALYGGPIDKEVIFTEVEKYFYDEEGKLIYAEYPSGGRRNYIYDEEGKLIREENDKGKVVKKYVYDEDGSLMYKEVY